MSSERRRERRPETIACDALEGGGGGWLAGGVVVEALRCADDRASQTRMAVGGCSDANNGGRLLRR